MPAIQLKRQEQILQHMISGTVTSTALTDLTDSSQIFHALKAVAREIDEVYFQLTRVSDWFSIDTASGEDLDARAKDIQPGTMRRIQPLRSISSGIVFSRQGTIGTVLIPAGTVVLTADGKSFRTTAQAQITAASTAIVAGHVTGQDSNAVAATAVNPGSIGNISTGAIVKFASKPSGVDSVANVVAFTGGRDVESDVDFRQRLKNYVASLAACTVQALEFATLGTTDVASGKAAVFTHVAEDPIYRGLSTLYIDDGNGTAASTALVSGEVVIASALGGEEYLSLDFKPIKLETPMTVTSSVRGTLSGGTLPAPVDAKYYVNPASGLLFFSPALVAGEVITASYTRFTGLIATVQKIIDGDPTDRTNYPGYRAAGTLVRVLSPSVVPVSVGATISVLEGYDQATVAIAAADAVTIYVNGLGISGDVIRNEIVQQIMDTPGVYDVNLAVPSSNKTILDNEVARISAGLIVVT